MMSRKENFLLVTITFLYTICLFYFFSDLPISPDEAYYWEWSRNLGLKYLDHGLGIAYWIKIFTFLFGDTRAALLIAALAGLFSFLLIVYLISRECGLSPRLSTIVTISIAITPGFFIGSSLITPDTGLILFGTVALYFAMRYIKQKSSVSLVLAFFFSAIAILFKFTVLTFGLGALVWIILFEPRIFRKPAFWLGTSIAIVIVAPIFYGGLEFQQERIRHYSQLFTTNTYHIFSMLGGQIIALSLPWFLIINFIMLFFLRKFIQENSIKVFLKNIIVKIRNLQQWDITKKQYAFLWLNFLTLQFIAFFMSFNRNIQINWLFPSYPAIILLNVYYIFHSNKEFFSRVFPIQTLRFIYYSGIFVSLLTITIVLYGENIAAFIKYRKISPTWFLRNRNIGYEEIVKKYNDHIEKISLDQWDLAATRYQDAAIASWYLPHNRFVRSLQFNRLDQYQYMDLPPLKNKVLILVMGVGDDTEKLKNIENRIEQFCTHWEKTDIYRGRNSFGLTIKLGRFFYCYRENNEV